MRNFSRNMLSIVIQSQFDFCASVGLDAVDLVRKLTIFTSLKDTTKLYNQALHGSTVFRESVQPVCPTTVLALHFQLSWSTTHNQFDV